MTAVAGFPYMFDFTRGWPTIRAVVGPDLYGRHQDSGAVAALFGAFRTCFLIDANND